MAMKRRSVTVCVLAIFLTWNVMTYIFLARPQQRGEDFSQDVQLRLDDLESELRDQVEMHEKILEQLEIARKNLQRDLLHQNPLSNIFNALALVKEQRPKHSKLSNRVEGGGGGNSELEGLAEVEAQLNFLELSIRNQITANEKLLRDLQDYRNLIYNTKAPSSSTRSVGSKLQTYNTNKTTRYNGADNKDVVVMQQQVQPVPDDGGNGAVELLDPQKVVLPVLVIACNRPTIKRNLDQLLKHRPSGERFPIIVSQDCGHKPTTDAIKSYGDKLTLIQQPELGDIPLPWPQRKFQGYYKIARHYKWAIKQVFESFNYDAQPDQSNIELPKKEKKFLGYYKISRHYKWALGQIFHEMNYDAVVIVEDDLDISPDFFEYFAATFPILHADRTLWCVSAWNDNGKANMVADEPELLYRTDFFPGLGWMLEKKTWLGIEDKWPKTFWDDWMRHPDQRQDRACIRPEISRTSTFGKVGVSKGQYFDKHLKFIKLNEKKVPFTQKDLSYLLKSRYDETFAKTVYSAPLLTLSQALTGAQPEHRTVRVQYSDKQSFKTQAKALGIMEDLKSGVPRAGYRGVVSFIRDGRRIYFAPPANWNGYDTSWS